MFGFGVIIIASELPIDRIWLKTEHSHLGSFIKFNIDYCSY